MSRKSFTKVVMAIISGFSVQSSRCQCSGVRCQDYEPDDVQNYQIPDAVLFLLKPDTRHLK